MLGICQVSGTDTASHLSKFQDVFSSKSDPYDPGVLQVSSEATAFDKSSVQLLRIVLWEDTV